MTSMLFIKETTYDVKLRCKCSREFWAAKRPGQKCPDCAIIWDCTFWKYFKISVQLKAGESFTVVMLGIAKSASAYVLHIMQAAPILFRDSSGFKVEEIFKVEFDSLDQSKIDADFVQLLQVQESRKS